MKSAKLIELQRQRGEVVAQAREKLDEIRNTEDDAKANTLEAEHDRILREFDNLALEIAQAELDAEEDELRAERRPGSSGVMAGTDDGSAAYPDSFEWMDQRGQPVRVVGRDGKVCERSHRGPSAGDLIRAKITGARNEAEERALSEGTDSAGGYTVPTPLAADFIDLMRANSVAIRAGAMTVPMESETLAIARLASDPTVAWRAENASIAEGDPTFDRVTFTAKTLAGGIKLSRELADDSLNVGRMIQTSLAEAMALKLDYAAIWGDGSSNSPTGIASTVGINTVSMGVNGAELDSYDELIDAVYELQLDNASDPTAMIYHPRTGAALAKLKDANNNPLVPPEMIARIPRLWTSAAPIDEEEGSATDASSIVFGDYRQLMIGMRQSLEIRIFDQTYASTGQLYVVAWMRTDVQLAQPKAFCPLTGIIPTAAS